MAHVFAARTDARCLLIAGLGATLAAMNAVVLSGDRPAAAGDRRLDRVRRDDRAWRSPACAASATSCALARLARRRLRADRIRGHRRLAGLALAVLNAVALRALHRARPRARRASRHGSSVDRLGAAMLVALVFAAPIGLRDASVAFLSPMLLLAGIGVGRHVLGHPLYLRPARDGAAAARDLCAHAGAAARDRGDRRRARAAADPLARSSCSASRWSAIGIAIHKPARREQAAGASFAAAIRFSRCTMKAVAKSGARRLTTGMATNAAMSSPGREDRPGMARAEAPDRRLVVMAERHQLEIFAAEEIGVGDEEDHRTPKPTKSTSGSANALTSSTTPRNFSDVGKRAPDRQRPAGRIGRVVRALDRLGDVVGEEADEERRDRRDQEAQGRSAGRCRRGCRSAVSSHGQDVAIQLGSSHSSAARARPAAPIVSASDFQQHAAERRREDVAEGESGGVDHDSLPSLSSCLDLIRASIPERKPNCQRYGMDCRVKPGNDDISGADIRAHRFAILRADPLGRTRRFEGEGSWPRRSSMC